MKLRTSHLGLAVVLLLSFSLRAQDAWVLDTPSALLVETTTGKQVAVPEQAPWVDLDTDSGTMCGFSEGAVNRLWLADLRRGQVMHEQQIDASDVPEHPKVVAAENGSCALTMSRGRLGILLPDGSLHCVDVNSKTGEAFEWVNLTYVDARHAWLALSKTGYALIASRSPLVSSGFIQPSKKLGDIQVSELVCCALLTRDGNWLYAVAKTVTEDDSQEISLLQINARTGDIHRTLLPYYPGQENDAFIARLKQRAGSASINEETKIDFDANENHLLVSGYMKPADGGEETRGILVVDLKSNAHPTLSETYPADSQMTASHRYYFAPADKQSLLSSTALWSVNGGKRVKTLSGSLIAIGHGGGQSSPAWQTDAPARLKPLPLLPPVVQHLDQITKLVVQMAAGVPNFEEFQVQLSEIEIQYRLEDKKRAVLDGERIAALDRATLDPNGTDSIPRFEGSTSDTAKWKSFQQQCQAFAKAKTASADTGVRRQAFCLLSALQ